MVLNWENLTSMVQNSTGAVLQDIANNFIIKKITKLQTVFPEQKLLFPVYKSIYNYVNIKFCVLEDIFVYIGTLLSLSN